MAVNGARQKIHETVLSWPDVTAHPHRFGGTEFRLGKRELGHIHGRPSRGYSLSKKGAMTLSLPVAPNRITSCLTAVGLAFA
jgi:hypothetical protein